MARSSSPDTTTAILRGAHPGENQHHDHRDRDQADAGPQKSNARTIVARSSSPDTITAILPDRCPARTA